MKRGGPIPKVFWIFSRELKSAKTENHSPLIQLSLSNHKGIRWRLLLIILAVSFVVWGGALVYASFSKNNLSKKTLSSEQILDVKYYSPNQFQKTTKLANELPDNFPENQTIKAGIFPHDLTHAEYIAHFLKNLKKQNPKNILLIGPNHFERGVSNILTTKVSWSTPFGKVLANEEIVFKLLQSTAAHEDALTIQQEHSINGILPYLAYYLPETHLIPLIFKSELNLRDIHYLVTTLDTILPADTVILASVDFSHYLISEEAKTKDAITTSILKTLDYQKIMSFGSRFNDYTDSPPSIALLLSWLSKNNIRNIKILFQTNSGILANNFTQPVTSYFEVVYY